MTNANQHADTEAHDASYKDGYADAARYYESAVDQVQSLTTQLEAANAERDRLKQLVDAAERIELRNGARIERDSIGYCVRTYDGSRRTTMRPIQKPGTMTGGGNPVGYKSMLDAYDSILSAAGEGKE